MLKVIDFDDLIKDVVIIYLKYLWEQNKITPENIYQVYLNRSLFEVKQRSNHDWIIEIRQTQIGKIFDIQGMISDFFGDLHIFVYGRDKKIIISGRTKQLVIPFSNSKIAFMDIENSFPNILKK